MTEDWAAARLESNWSRYSKGREGCKGMGRREVWVRRREGERRDVGVSKRSKEGRQLPRQLLFKDCRRCELSVKVCLTYWCPSSTHHSLVHNTTDGETANSEPEVCFAHTTLAPTCNYGQSLSWLIVTVEPDAGVAGVVVLGVEFLTKQGKRYTVKRTSWHALDHAIEVQRGTKGREDSFHLKLCAWHCLALTWKRSKVSSGMTLGSPPLSALYSLSGNTDCRAGRKMSRAEE